MKIDVVEAIGVDHAHDERLRRVGRESDVADASFLAPTFGDFQAASRQRPIHRFLVVDSVEREEIQVVDPQKLKRFLELRLECFHVRRGAHLGLQQEGIPPVTSQRRPELGLAGAIAARGFDVRESQRKRAVERCFEVLLVGRRCFHAARPRFLVAHPSEGKDRKREVGSAKASVQHGGDCSVKWDARERVGRTLKC